MADDNVVKFTGNTSRMVTINNASQTVLIIRPDGTKLRHDNVPLNKLNRYELLTIIDQLCDLIAAR